MQIKHLKHKAIDFERWDSAIAASNNQLPYAFSWYLNTVSPGWEALVSKDYGFIMPLPVKKKYGFKYLVQPKLTQQLGIFSKSNIDENTVKSFIRKIAVTSYELNLNEKNFHPKANSAPNFILDLNRPYAELALHYSKNTIRNIEKAKKLQLTLQSNLSVEEFLSFYESVEKKYPSADQSLVKELIKKGLTKNSISLHAVFSANQKLIAALCLLHSKNRLTYLLPLSNDAGKSSSAMFLLIDSIIRENSESNTLFDFEGSKIEGIARFYKGFGAENRPYYIIKRLRPSTFIRKLLQINVKKK